MGEPHTRRSRRAVAYSTFVAVSAFVAIAASTLRVAAAKQLVLAYDARLHAQLRPTSNSAADAAPVVVELFTSEGCSSCPPADALLDRLDRDQPVPGVHIIALEEHVDYWDHLGWKDRFSSAYITERQRNYENYFNLGESYTPQVVVNGASQFNGADAPAITAAVRTEASRSALLQFAMITAAPHTIRFQLQNQPRTYQGYVRIYAALVDPHDATEVNAGENNGRTLEHAGVVRTFSLMGESFHLDTIGKTPFSISPPGASAIEGMRLVIFVQKKPIGEVLAAVSCTVHVPTHPSPSLPAADACPDAAVGGQTTMLAAP